MRLEWLHYPDPLRKSECSSSSWCKFEMVDNQSEISVG
ncbi:hypothetical protein VC87395_003020 [Vibrio paracholerae 87395]|nr:hypothetical protein VC87395_003020 [Vibrio paracholerae 87395]